MGTVMNYQYVENCTESGHSTTAHWHESATDKTEIVGVYGKIANMTISEISEKDASGNSGIERIMAGLTIGAEKAECMDFWQSVPVSDFMSALLSGI